jgi:hypothetical protein
MNIIQAEPGIRFCIAAIRKKVTHFPAREVPLASFLASFFKSPRESRAISSQMYADLIYRIAIKTFVNKLSTSGNNPNADKVLRKSWPRVYRKHVHGKSRYVVDSRQTGFAAGRREYWKRRPKLWQAPNSSTTALCQNGGSSG